jgi:ribosome modulation factor
MINDNSAVPSMSDAWKRGHEAGVYAYCLDKGIEACPSRYQKGEEYRSAWVDGWNDARRLDERGNLDKDLIL